MSIYDVRVYISSIRNNKKLNIHNSFAFIDLISVSFETLFQNNKIYMWHILIFFLINKLFAIYKFERTTGFLTWIYRRVINYLFALYSFSGSFKFILLLLLTSLKSDLIDRPTMRSVREREASDGSIHVGAMRRVSDKG